MAGRLEPVRRHAVLSRQEGAPRAAFGHGPQALRGHDLRRARPPGRLELPAGVASGPIRRSRPCCPTPRRACASSTRPDGKVEGRTASARGRSTFEFTLLFAAGSQELTDRIAAWMQQSLRRCRHTDEDRKDLRRTHSVSAARPTRSMRRSPPSLFDATPDPWPLQVADRERTGVPRGQIGEDAQSPGRRSQIDDARGPSFEEDRTACTSRLAGALVESDGARDARLGRGGAGHRLSTERWTRRSSAPIASDLIQRDCRGPFPAARWIRRVNRRPSRLQHPIPGPGGSRSTGAFLSILRAAPKCPRRHMARFSRPGRCAVWPNPVGRRGGAK